jgi:hypothetical protein
VTGVVAFDTACATGAETVLVLGMVTAARAFAAKAAKSARTARAIAADVRRADKAFDELETPACSPIPNGFRPGSRISLALTHRKPSLDHSKINPRSFENRGNKSPELAVATPNTLLPPGAWASTGGPSSALRFSRTDRTKGRPPGRSSTIRGQVDRNSPWMPLLAYISQDLPLQHRPLAGSIVSKGPC